MLFSHTKPLIASVALALPSCSTFSKLGWEQIVGPKGATRASPHEVGELRGQRIVTAEFKGQFPTASRAFVELCEGQIETATALSLGKDAGKTDAQQLARLEMQFLRAMVADLERAGVVAPQEKKTVCAESNQEKFVQAVEAIFHRCGLEVSIDSLSSGRNGQYVFVRVERRQEVHPISELHALLRAMDPPNSQHFDIEKLVLLAKTELETPPSFVAQLMPAGAGLWRIVLNEEALDRLAAKTHVSREVCEKTVVADECGRAVGKVLVEDPKVIAKAKELDLDELLLVGIIRDYYGARFGNLGLMEKLLSMRAGKIDSILPSELFALGKEKARFYATEREAILAEFEALFERVGIPIPRK